MGALPESSWLLTVEEYLAFEEQSDVRHEYVGGEIHAMVGASVRHAQIVWAISTISSATQPEGAVVAW
jgi:Uma2 family endonuclease